MDEEGGAEPEPGFKRLHLAAGEALAPGSPPSGRSRSRTPRQAGAPEQATAALPPMWSARQEGAQALLDAARATSGWALEGDRELAAAPVQLHQQLLPLEAAPEPPRIEGPVPGQVLEQLLIDGGDTWRAYTSPPGSPPGFEVGSGMRNCCAAVSGQCEAATHAGTPMPPRFTCCCLGSGLSR